MPATFRFALRDLPPEAERLRAEVREFLDEQLGGARPVKRAKSWGGFDREFSRRVGARGWIGMTWPKRYGGGERSFLERYTVTEELLAAGALGVEPRDHHGVEVLGLVDQQVVAGHLQASQLGRLQVDVVGEAQPAGGGQQVGPRVE